MTFKYQPYYEYKPTQSNFIVDELTQEEVERNKRLLADDLCNHFNEIGGAVDISTDGVISITTHVTQKECDDIVAGYLSSLHLFARKVHRGR